MATQSWSTRIRHDSDANFREWGGELNARLAALGLVKTADTGQINWATVVRAGTSSDAGYEIWRFDDAQQATAPIFIKLFYGTGTGLSNPRLRAQVGTGSNGSGTLTGTTSGTDSIGPVGTSAASDTPRQSYASYSAGFFGLYLKVGGFDGSFFVARTVDGLGVADSRGAIAHWGNGTITGYTRRQAFRYTSTAVAYTSVSAIADGQLGFIAQAPLQSLAGVVDLQVAVGWTIVPQVTPLVGVCGVYSSELAIGGTFSATLVGATARTYLTLPNNAGPFGPLSTTATGGLNIAMLWE